MSGERLRPRGGRPFIKVCGIQSEAEAKLAARMGATAVGFVSQMPSGPGVIDEAAIARIVPTVPAPATPVLLTAALDPDTVIAQVARTGAGAVQLVESQPAYVHRALRRALPELAIIQVVHVCDASAIDEALEVAARPQVDALLLDSGNPRAAIKVLGGTGRTHDWAISEQICRRSPIPVVLAGGLNASNVGEAFTRVRPAGVDVCTGVRTRGELDEGRLVAFFGALRTGVADTITSAAG